MSQKPDLESSINSLALRSGRKFDYSDIFSINLNPNTKIQVEDLFPMFFESLPKVFLILVIIRETAAKLIGLKTSSKKEFENHLKNYTGEIGQRIALAEVLEKNSNELLAGLDDKHLDFRLSFVLEKCEETIQLKVGTYVRFNNWIGRLYYFLVKPIHRLFMPRIVKNMKTQIQAKSIMSG